MLLLNVGNEGDKIMVALCVNLAINPVCAQELLKKNRLPALMMRAFTYQDPMLMKMLHNLSEHPMSASSFIVLLLSYVKLVFYREIVTFRSLLAI